MPGKRTKAGPPLAAAGLVVALALALIPAGAGAAPIEPQKGTYRGKTKQESVTKSARRIEFKVNKKKTRITLTLEPAVGRNFCISPPVFTIEGPVKAKLKRGRFGFVRTFSGSRFNRIRGRFVAPDKIEGEAIYYFDESDAGLCSAGRTKVRFIAKRKKG